MPPQGDDGGHDGGGQEEHEAVVHPAGRAGGDRPRVDVREARGPREAAEALGGHEEPAELAALVLGDDVRRGDRQREHDLFVSREQREGRAGGWRVGFHERTTRRPHGRIPHPPAPRNAVACVHLPVNLDNLAGWLKVRTPTSPTRKRMKGVCQFSIHPSCVSRHLKRSDIRPPKQQRAPPACAFPLLARASTNSRSQYISVQAAPNKQKNNSTTNRGQQHPEG